MISVYSHEGNAIVIMGGITLVSLLRWTRSYLTKQWQTKWRESSRAAFKRTGQRIKNRLEKRGSIHKDVVSKSRK